MDEKETKKEKTYNIYYLNGKLVVTDDTPHAIDQFIADEYGFDPEDDDDFERILDIGEDIVDVAHDLTIKQVDIAGITDFADPNTHAVYYKI